MRKIKNILFFAFLSILISGCQTIKEKTDKIVEKENEKLSKFIGKSSKDLQIELGNPNEDFRNENGNLVCLDCDNRDEVSEEMFGSASAGDTFIDIKKTEGKW